MTEPNRIDPLAPPPKPAENVAVAVINEMTKQAAEAHDSFTIPLSPTQRFAVGMVGGSLSAGAVAAAPYVHGDAAIGLAIGTAILGFVLTFLGFKKP